MLENLPLPLWQIGAGLVGAVVLLRLIKKILSGGGKSDQHVSGSCSCGWRGSVSKYRPVCPKCGTRLANN